MREVERKSADPPVVQGAAVVVQGTPIVPTSIATNTLHSSTNNNGCTQSNKTHDDSNSNYNTAASRKDNRIGLTPGESWISRQTTSEVLSLSWSSDDENDIIHQILSLLRQKQCLGCIHIAMLFSFMIMFLSLYENHGHKIGFKICLGVIFSVQVLSLVRMSSLDNKLNELFLQFRTAKIQRQQQASGNDSRRTIRVKPDQNWIARHTEQEILSLSWDEEDLPDVLLLLEKRRKYTNTHGMVSLALFFTLFMFLFGSPLLSVTVAYVLLGLFLGLFLVSVYLSILTSRLIQTFQSKFDERFQSSVRSEYQGEAVQGVV